MLFFPQTYQHFSGIAASQTFTIEPALLETRRVSKDVHRGLANAAGYHDSLRDPEF